MLWDWVSVATDHLYLPSPLTPTETVHPFKQGLLREDSGYFWFAFFGEIHLSSGVLPAPGRSGGRVLVSQGFLQAQGQVLGLPSKAELTAPKLIDN